MTLHWTFFGREQQTALRRSDNKEKEKGDNAPRTLSLFPLSLSPRSLAAIERYLSWRQRVLRPSRPSSGMGLVQNLVTASPQMLPTEFCTCIGSSSPAADRHLHWYTHGQETRILYPLESMYSPVRALTMLLTTGMQEYTVKQRCLTTTAPKGRQKKFRQKNPGVLPTAAAFGNPLMRLRVAFGKPFMRALAASLILLNLRTVPRQNVRPQNVRRDKTSGEKTSGEKTSGDLMFVGQNVRRDKTSGGTKRPGGDQASFCKYKNKNNHFVYLVGHYIFRNLYVLQHVDSKKQYIASEQQQYILSII